MTNIVKDHYLIKQTIPCLDTNIIKVYCPCNLNHLRKLISLMMGVIEVFLISGKDGKREDLTDSLGNRNFNIYDHQFELIRLVKIVYSSEYFKNIYISYYTLLNVRPEDLPTFFMLGVIYKNKHGVEHNFSKEIFTCNIEEHNRKKNYGNYYEEFISNKYLDYGYDIENRGIKESFNDGGLDIIAKKDNSIVLVQCKNWSMSNTYKINQKDLRAFVGDCFLYLKDINLEGIKVSYHYIVSHENILTKSAQIFLKENSFIKFKCIPYESSN